MGVATRGCTKWRFFIFSHSPIWMEFLAHIYHAKIYTKMSNVMGKFEWKSSNFYVKVGVFCVSREPISSHYSSNFYLDHLQSTSMYTRHIEEGKVFLIFFLARRVWPQMTMKIDNFSKEWKPYYCLVQCWIWAKVYTHVQSHSLSPHMWQSQAPPIGTRKSWTLLRQILLHMLRHLHAIVF